MKTNRRDFLKTLGGIAAFTIVPRHVLGNGFIAPSDQLTKGIIGTGGMGRGHVDYAGTRLVAVCDVDKNHLDAAGGFFVALVHPNKMTLLWNPFDLGKLGFSLL